MLDKYSQEDCPSLAEGSTSNYTQGNMSYVSGSSGFGTNSSGDEDNYRRPGSSARKQDVATREQRAVTRSKLFVGIFLVLAAFATAAGTYLFVQDNDYHDFEEEFRGHATEIAIVTSQKVDQLFNALKSFSITASSEAISTNQTWPFVTINDWSTKVRSLGELVGVPETRNSAIFCPVVDKSDLSKWPWHTMEAAPVFYQNAIDTEGYNKTADELTDVTTPAIHYYDPENMEFSFSDEMSLPIWQIYPLEIFPVTQRMPTNIDLMKFFQFRDLFLLTNAIREATIGFSEYDSEDRQSVSSQIMQPIFKTTDTEAEDREVGGVLILSLEWTSYFEGFFGEDTGGIILVLRNSCPRWSLYNEQSVSETEENHVSFVINGPEATFLGEYDAHDPKYDSLEVTSILVDLDVDSSKIPSGQCIPKISLHLYPTESFENAFDKPRKFLYAGGVLAIFAFTSLIFLLYDYFVGRRQTKVMDRIMRQDQIVANIFPTAIRDRLYDGLDRSNGNLADPLDLENDTGRSKSSSPIADLFPSTTLVFSDISGFTAWASAREPQQVFTLLESIYASFDKIAYRHDVFKVETVGDCYVAAVGIPDPIEEHALVACKFARDCIKRMNEIILKLEVTLGPDTSDLRLRVGIHSGQVTAGVLRGERSRFQLFGDTVNLASRMESTGKANAIHISQTTADLLKEGGFANMILPRSQKTYVKGKGQMQTYWLRTARQMKALKLKAKASSGLRIESTINEEDTVEESFSSSSDNDRDDDDLFEMKGVERMNKTQRLVEWHVKVLSSLLQQVVDSRGGSRKSIKPLQAAESHIRSGQTILEEFVPIIQLKRLEKDDHDMSRRRHSGSSDVGEGVEAELRSFLSEIAQMYTDTNPFHNFEHASHVTASVKKLLKRIVSVDTDNGLKNQNPNSEMNLVDLAGHSYGITSDPLTQFAVVFSAIIHDLDHPGVPNAQLVKENAPNATLYKNKSVAEQNSVELAWNLLMKEEYEDLRSCIYQTEEELRRFRQLVVNTVMATDIVDKELQALRKARWEGAFSAGSSGVATVDVQSEDRKATIVIEHLIQASDVSHTMQHWYIYKSWNEKFFCECYKAYKEGRAETDPSINWYKGEIGFFDFYVIPLAKKLDDCGVFGVSSHEYLNYATANREEWVREGEALVKEFIENYNKEDI